MAQTPEAKAKAVVTSLLKEAGAYYTMSVTSGFGKSGAPDITGCFKGWYFGVEVKADTKVTRLQEHHLQLIRDAGGKAWVVRISSKGVEENLSNLKHFLRLE
jgi:Holliday junction resolvase